MKRYLPIGVLLGALALGACQDASEIDAPPTTQAADVLLVNGQIKTLDGWASTLAVKDGRFIIVGDDSASQSIQAAQTIDLAGKTILPGIFDTHVHPVFGGILRKSCVITQGSNLDALRASVQYCAENAKPGDWITGGQWDASAIGQIPTRAMIDDLTPDNPVILNDTSGHSVLVNTAALELAKVTAETKSPEGGIIERGADGQPTGVLREEAIGLVRTLVPPPSLEQTKEALAWAAEEMLSYGITSFNEASLGFTSGSKEEFEVYANFSEDGTVKQRVRICMTWAANYPEAEEIIASRAAYERERLKPDCVKVFLDGVPTDSHTAAMIEDYAGTIEGRDDEASRRGLLLVNQDLLNETVARFDALGLTVKFHAAGDAAVRAGLDAIEYTRAKNGMNDLHHNPGHCTFIHPDDIPRAAPLNATFELSPYLWAPTPINDDITAAVGEPRISRVWPFKDIVNSDALVVAGSDWAVVPSVNPWPAIETMITRQRPGGSPDAFGRGQGIELEQAIDIFTINAAKHMNREADLGSISEGKLADFIVLDRNPYEIATNEIHKTQVLMTYIEGELVYSAQQ